VSVDVASHRPYQNTALPFQVPVIMKKTSHKCSHNIFFSHGYFSALATDAKQLKRYQNKAQRLPKQRSAGQRTPRWILALLLMLGGAGLGTGSAIAQPGTVSTPSEPDIIFEPNTGRVRIDRNAFEIESGGFGNSSEIPLPDGLVRETSEGVAVPTTSQRLAPNSVEFGTDVEFVNDAFRDATTGSGRPELRIRPDTLRLERAFNISRSVGEHDFGEGIEVIVRNSAGEVISREQAFVRGDVVSIGPDGNALPETGRIAVEYGAEDSVELRVLNIREDNAQPSESGIYFADDGSFVVEDLQEGGDRDFNDGEYLQNPEGSGEAIAGSELNDVIIEETTDETPLDPSIRTDEVIEQDIVQVLQEADERVQEERDWGSVELPESNATRLGHARGAVSEAGELLIYDRYSASNQFRLGSNGVGISGQLKPLFGNPGLPPTLLFGNANFDPFVGNNEAGLVGTLGITQFLTRTHREATDMFGAELPRPDGKLLLEPAGLFNNRRMVGYVPARADETVRGEALASVDGIFEIPEGASAVIEPAQSNTVGLGNAAYTRNVGGVIIESPSGGLSFIAQWTEAGYEQAPITLESGEAQRVIYALVPQQAGQNIQLGQRYDVINAGSAYRIADGNFTIISSDKHPENFQQEQSEIYAVEDTLPAGNLATSFFNGIRGVYAESIGAQPVPTVDPDIPAEADARVGNELFTLDLIPGDPGQMAYAQVSRAGGFYLGGALSGGIGNQEDQVRRTTTDMQLQTDELRTTQIQNTFLTPLMQMDAIVTERTTITENFGTASFDINSNGELTNVNFVETGNPVSETREEEISRVSEIVQGEETQVGSEVISVSSEVVDSELIEGDSTVSEGQDSYANFSSLEGELAVGGVYNFGNTPWSQAANTVRAELFARDSVLGRSGSETGWRAEVLFHPFGEAKREAFQYDAAGQVVPVYKTEPLLGANGQQMVELITGANGELVEMMMNQFVLDENGDRSIEKVGTGTAKGPGIYIRLEDAFDDDEGVILAGGLQFAF